MSEENVLYAFPIDRIDSDDDSDVLVSSLGMTLRDYFAARAMQAIISSPNFGKDFDAIRAYEVADAMLDVRKGGNA
jgi:hypothetical protein